eukprot:TRINITY_DN1978_c0_g1_i1.p1 TRINITY_DN1978_c0_g1~~TRINITY_DN1978_c0_g1_i1.p1  ORF type:complete len:253 (-),score=52.77 TRINITY_DN1978_c0_g1_i1:36-764(-)
MSARTNQSTEATFKEDDLTHPFAEGAFRYVAHGVYVNGPREGSLAVCKWFKVGFSFEETFFDQDIRAVQKALWIIDRWNDSHFIDKKVILNIPGVWTFTDGNNRTGHKCLIEPFIEHWEKFNSNSGWVNSGTNWRDVMQALSHYSYHCTDGQFVLCDLQGGVYSDGVVLSDPVILSHNRSYGVTDLGNEGIESFFHRHQCNSFCKSTWATPRFTKPSIPMAQGTSMLYIPTESERAPMTHKK